MQYGLFQQYELIDQFSIDMMLVGLEAQIMSDVMSNLITENCKSELKISLVCDDLRRALSYNISYLRNLYVISNIKSSIRLLRNENKVAPIQLTLTCNLPNKDT